MRGKLLRLIIPAYPESNICTSLAGKTTALGPILVASTANKIPGWEVEVIDENNFRTFRPHWLALDALGRIDHAKLQLECPADIVGFYASFSSTIPRVFELAEIYHSLGCVTVAGGYHVQALPDEALANNIDIVAMDGGEKSLPQIMKRYFGDTISDKTKNCELRPLPDFSLLRWADLQVYPINWRRGCPLSCEFCAVKEKPSEAGAEELLEIVSYCHEKFNAKKFFIIDDRFGGNLNDPAERAEVIKALRLLGKYNDRDGRWLSFTVQAELLLADDTELLSEMRLAGVTDVRISFDHPYSFEKQKLKALWRSYAFKIHGQFILAYPKKLSTTESRIPLAEQVEKMKRFIKYCQFDSVSVSLAVPIPGSELRQRLDAAGRLIPLAEKGWECYDGRSALYLPDNCSPAELEAGLYEVINYKAL